MTDKELLELAAKAAGHKVQSLASKHIAQGVSDFALLILNDRGGSSVFDPLTDDGDRYRLARQFGITLNFSNCFASKHVSDSEEILKKWKFGDKEGEARAVVEVAAEIGKTL